MEILCTHEYGISLVRGGHLNDVSNGSHIFTLYFSCRSEHNLQKIHNINVAVFLLLHSGLLLRATTGHFSFIFCRAQVIGKAVSYTHLTLPTNREV